MLTLTLDQIIDKVVEKLQERFKAKARVKKAPYNTIRIIFLDSELTFAYTVDERDLGSYRGVRNDDEAVDFLYQNVLNSARTNILVFYGL